MEKLTEKLNNCRHIWQFIFIIAFISAGVIILDYCGDGKLEISILSVVIGGLLGLAYKLIELLKKG